MTIKELKRAFNAFLASDQLYAVSQNPNLLNPIWGDVVKVVGIRDLTFNEDGISGVAIILDIDEQVNKNTNWTEEA